MRSDDLMQQLCEALRAECGAGPDFELSLGDLIGKYRQTHEKRMRDAQAAELLPKYGPDAAAERLGVCRRSVYYMAERGGKIVQVA